MGVAANVTENINHNEVVDEIYESRVNATKQSKIAEEVLPSGETLEKIIEEDGEGAIHYCICCRFSANDVKVFLEHLDLEEHTMNTKNQTKYAIMECRVCSMSFKKNRDIVRHLKTKKHTKNVTSEESNKKISSRRNKGPVVS